MEKVLITGGSGLVGSHLSKKLIENGFDVAILSRETIQEPGVTSYLWNPYKNEIDPEAISTADIIIHLAGAGIGEKRWTSKRKKTIIESRVETANIILEKIKENKNRVKAFISASAIGYYGSINSEKIFSEVDKAADDFLGKTCCLWEQSADRFEEAGIRTVKIRTGVVLASHGSALQQMITPVKLGIGSAIGSGRQYLPWIHIEDLCNIYLKAIKETQMTGPYNAVAPDFITNKSFYRTLSRVLSKPFWFPAIPSILIKIIFGSRATILLDGSRVSSDKIRNAGYIFLFPDLESALKDLVQN